MTSKTHNFLNSYPLHNDDFLKVFLRNSAVNLLKLALELWIIKVLLTWSAIAIRYVTVIHYQRFDFDLFHFGHKSHNSVLMIVNTIEA